MTNATPAGKNLRRERWRWLLVIIPAVVVAGLFANIFLELRNTVWSYYTDDGDITFAYGERPTRMALWEDPYLTPAGFNTNAHPVETAFSPDGANMVFTGVHGETDDFSLFLSTWDGSQWSTGTLMAAVSSAKSTDTDPTWSRDGSVLYFASDREGGLGGFDIWAARCREGKWGAVTNLGAAVNSAADDYEPAIAPDDTCLYLSSDRNGTLQVYEAGKIDVPQTTNAVPLEFKKAVPFAPLNSVDAGSQVTWSPSGRRIYTVSDKDGGEGGFDIYSTRVLNGEFIETKNAGLEFNTSSDESSPSIRWQGFGMIFSSSRRSDEDLPEEMRDSKLFSTTQREVVSRLDLSRWNRLMNLLDRIKWWILGLILALAVLLWLLSHWRDLSTLFQKCLLASVIFHVILLVIFFFTRIIIEITESREPESVEVSMNVDNLAKEKLALEMSEQVTEMPEAPATIPIQKIDQAVPIPEFTPRITPVAEPIVTRTTDKSFVVKVTPSAAQEKVVDVAAAKAFKVMPELDMPEIQVTLEEFVPRDTQDKKDVQKTFEPVVVQEDVQVRKREHEKPQMTAVTKTASESDVQSDATTDAAATTIRDTGGDTIVASAGEEAPGSLPELSGTGDLIGLMIKSAGTGPELRIDAPGELDVPESVGATISPDIIKNPGKLSLETVEGLGGSAVTQGAVARALEWFTRHQEQDGSWNVKKHGGSDGHDIAGTSLALLCYYGWGAKHTEDGPYRHTVKKAIDWLVAQQQDNGSLTGQTGQGMYDHGIASIALCEAYGFTKDPTLREPATRAIKFLEDAQSANGGWRYRPNSSDSDTSVFGWQYMALKSAELAGLDVSQQVLAKADSWLDKVSSGKHGGIYGYQGRDGNRKAMIPTGMFCRQLAKVPPADPRMREGAAYMSTRPIDARNLDYYYLYYGTLALYQHQGKIWEDWNTRMKEILPELQEKTGSNAGSWNPQGGNHGNQMGRVITTGISTLSLEVFYRILPIYGFRDAEEE